MTGDVHESAAQVVAAAGLAHHPPVLDVNGGAAAAGIERLPWVSSAAVHTSWPDGVHIVITEEIPRLVIGGPGGTWAVLSADGRVLQVAPGARPPGLLLVAVPVAPGAPGTTLPAKDAAALEVASTPAPVVLRAGDCGVGRTRRMGAAVDDDADRGEHRLRHAVDRQIRGRLGRSCRCNPPCGRRDRRQCSRRGNGDARVMPYA